VTGIDTDSIVKNPSTPGKCIDITLN
jgi:hypothetical protein